MADSEPLFSPEPAAICYTCVMVLEKYGTTESVVPWLCTCKKSIPHQESTSTDLQDRLSWSKMSPEVQRITWRNHNPPSK